MASCYINPFRFNSQNFFSIFLISKNYIATSNQFSHYFTGTFAIFP